MKLIEVPQWQKDLAEELRKQEQSIDDMLPSIPVDERAKCYVCLAYDWYRMGATVEGQKLIWKAEATCPGYFENQARKQMAESPTYNFIMNSIAMILKGIVNERNDE